MRLPSLHLLFQQAKHAFLRFPLTIISSLISVCLAIYMIELENEIKNLFPYINLMLCTALGIPLYFCVSVFSDNKRLATKFKWLLFLVATAILALLYFSFPDSDSTQNTTLPYIRYAIYNIAIHLLASFIPFIGSDNLNGFWHYNKMLFLRFWTAVLYSGFLYIGLVLAIVAVRILFDVDVDEKIYVELFITIIGFFNTWFFVAGIPEQFDDLEALTQYPKGLKIFSQFVLLPLLCLYLIILYAYTGKILFAWNWPRGIVSYLIVCVSVLGILTALLIHPYGNLQGNTWIKKFSKIYYFILFPLVVVLFIAIGMRLMDYGITINRYIILLLGIWLTMVCVFFAIGKTNIKFIPVSLCIMLITVSFGPWGMFSVSERSQVHRLQTILEQGKILQADKIQKEVIWKPDSSLIAEKEATNEGILSDSLHNEVKSILDYLDFHHGFVSIQAWYTQNIDSIARVHSRTIKNRYRINESRIYMTSMGLKHEHFYPNNDSDITYFHYSTVNEEVIPVSNYDYLIELHSYSYDRRPETRLFTINDMPSLIVYPYQLTEKFIFTAQGDTIAVPLDELVQTLMQRYGKDLPDEIPNSEMTMQAPGRKFDIQIQLHDLRLNEQGDTLTFNSIQGNLLIKVKK